MSRHKARSGIMFKRVVLVLAIIAVPVVLLAQGEGPTLPGEIPIWGGIGLSIVMSVVVTGLRVIGVIKEGSPVKKGIGIALAIVGGLIAGVYASQTGVTEPADFLTYVAAGLFIGLGSVGMHSTIKNTKEAVGKK